MVITKPSGSAPLAARSETFTRSALRAMVAGRIVGEEMHASDDSVRRDDQIAARGGREAGHVVLEAKRAGARDRREQRRDEIVFGQRAAHGASPFLEQHLTRAARIPAP